MTIVDPRGLLLTFFCWGGLPLCGVTVPDLLNQADLIVVGTPSGLTVQPNGVVMSISVASRLSELPSAAGASVQVSWLLSIGQAQSVKLPSPPKAGIWFLKNLGNGLYAPLPAHETAGATPAISNLFFEANSSNGCPVLLNYAPSDPPIDKVAMEMACAASVEQDTSLWPGAIVSAACGPGASGRMHAAAVYLSQMPGARQKAIGIACLIAAKDTLGTTLLDQHIQELSDKDVTRFVAILVTAWRDPDPARVNSLGQLALNPRTTGLLLRLSAETLADIHTAEALPWFDKLLDRNEKDAQLNAIMGLVQYINGYPIRTPESFKDMSFAKSSPTPYSADTSWRSFVPQPDASDAQMRVDVSFWKAWLRTQKLVQ
jgi:hypothetical protein